LICLARIRQECKGDQWEDLMIRIFGSDNLEDDYLTEEDEEGSPDAKVGLKRCSNKHVPEPLSKRARCTE
jgi:hypothetical protein